MKTSEEVLKEKITIAVGALTQMNTFINGLLDTPDNATIGNLRNIIEANNSIVLKSLLEICC